MGFMKDVVLKVIGIGGKVLLFMTAGIVAERIADKFLPQKQEESTEAEEEDGEEEKTDSTIWSYNQQQ